MWTGRAIHSVEEQSSKVATWMSSSFGIILKGYRRQGLMSIILPFGIILEGYSNQGVS